MVVIGRTHHVLRVGIAGTVSVIGIRWLLGPATVRRRARAVIVQVTRANRDGRRHGSTRRISRTRAGRLLLAIQDQARALGGRQHVVHGYDAVRTRTSRIVHDRHVRLHPHPAAGFRQKPIVSRCHLTLAQHCQQGNDAHQLLAKN